MDCSVLLLWAFILPAGSACVLLTIIAWVAHRYGQLWHCSLIYFWVPSSCFCIVINTLSEEEIIPFSGVCWQSGEGCIIHAGGGSGFTHWLTSCSDVQQTAIAATSSRRASFSALASANSFVYFASSASNIAWRICMSVIAMFASFQFSGIFSRWAL